ncbi:MAG: hypothetical protein WDO69_25120 [Pseudomonadota bacterium]
MTTWPFERVFPDDQLTDSDRPFPVVTGAQLTKIDEQLSRAADGQTWTDSMVFHRFELPVPLSGRKYLLAYETVSQGWLAFGLDAALHADAQISFDAGRVWNTLALGLPSVTFQPTCAAADGAGTIVLGYNPIGIGGDGKTTQRAVYTGDLFATTSAVITAYSTAAAVSVYFSRRLGLWIMSLSDGTLWTAFPGLLDDWTLSASLPDSLFDFCESDDRILALTSGTSGVGYSSLDGMTWTSITVPSGPDADAMTFVRHPGSYGPGSGRFLLHVKQTEELGEYYSSPDGSHGPFGSWVPAGNVTGPGNSRHGAMAASGLVAVIVGNGPWGIDVYRSRDFGSSWRRSGSISAANAVSNLAIVVGDGRCVVLYCSATGESFAYPTTIAVGGL